MCLGILGHWVGCQANDEIGATPPGSAPVAPDEASAPGSSAFGPATSESGDPAESPLPAARVADPASLVGGGTSADPTGAGVLSPELRRAVIAARMAEAKPAGVAAARSRVPAPPVGPSSGC